MTGREELIRMRLEGRIPALLYVDLDVGRMPGEGHLSIHIGEPLYSLDLRGVQGLVVSVSGMDSPRVLAVGLACEQAGARRVITNHMRVKPGGEFETVEVTDTEGLFTWKM